jgi:hypothetical protein
LNPPPKKIPGFATGKDTENYPREKFRALEEHNKIERTRELHQQIKRNHRKIKTNTGTIKKM